MRLSCVHADFGKEFPSPTLQRGPCSNCPSLSKLCAVPLALQNRALFEGEREGRKGAEGQKKKKVKTSQASSVNTGWTNECDLAGNWQLQLETPQAPNPEAIEEALSA